MAQGYTVFVIRGKLPLPPPQPYLLEDPHWVRMSEKKSVQRNNRNDNLTEKEREQMEEMELEAAIAASLAGSSTREFSRIFWVHSSTTL